MARGERPKLRRLTASELSFARLVRFYGIDPLRLAELSEYPELWAILANAVGPLRAEEMLNGIHVASMPHAKRSQARRFTKQLERELRTYTPPPVQEKAEERDPQKAAEWFKAIGVGVV